MQVSSEQGWDTKRHPAVCSSANSKSQTTHSALSRLLKFSAVLCALPLQHRATAQHTQPNLRHSLNNDRDLSNIDAITDLSTTNIELDSSYTFNGIANNATIQFALKSLDALAIKIDNQSGARLTVTVNCPSTQQSEDFCEKASDFRLQIFPRRYEQGLLFLKPGAYSIQLAKTGFSASGGGTFMLERQDRLSSAATVSDLRRSTVLVDSLALQPGETMNNQVVEQALCFESYLCEPRSLNLSFFADEASVQTKQIYYTQQRYDDQGNLSEPKRIDPEKKSEGHYAGMVDFETGVNHVCLTSTKFKVIDLYTNVTLAGAQTCDPASFFGWNEQPLPLPATDQPTSVPVFTPSPTQSQISRPTRNPTFNPSAELTVSPSAVPVTPSPTMTVNLVTSAPTPGAHSTEPSAEVVRTSEPSQSQTQQPHEMSENTLAPTQYRASERKRLDNGTIAAISLGIAFAMLAVGICARPRANNASAASNRPGNADVSSSDELG